MKKSDGSAVEDLPRAPTPRSAASAVVDSRTPGRKSLESTGGSDREALSCTVLSSQYVVIYYKKETSFCSRKGCRQRDKTLLKKKNRSLGNPASECRRSDDSGCSDWQQRPAVF